MLLSLFILKAKGASIDKTYLKVDSAVSQYHLEENIMRTQKEKVLSPLSVELKITFLELAHLKPG